VHLIFPFVISHQLTCFNFLPLKTSAGRAVNIIFRTSTNKFNQLNTRVTNKLWRESRVSSGSRRDLSTLPRSLSVSLPCSLVVSAVFWRFAPVDVSLHLHILPGTLFTYHRHHSTMDFCTEKVLNLVELSEKFQIKAVLRTDCNNKRKSVEWKGENGSNRSWNFCPN